jgi:3-oxoadipate enol-lactonase
LIPVAPANGRRSELPWIDANGVSIRYDAAGSGPAVVLLHEMGGTMESWDGIVPDLSRTFRTLRYDQRGAGLSEKVRRPFTNEMLVDDLEAVLDGLGLTPPFHFVTVAAATAQALVFMQRRPQAVASFVFCNPLAGIDPSRAGALEDRAALIEREGMRAGLAVTLDKSWPPDIGDRAAYEAYRGRYLAYDPWCFGAVNRMLAHTNVTHLVKDIGRPTMIVAGRFDQVRPPAVSEQFARSIPGARFELIDAVHMLPAQAPGPLLALLQDFLAGAGAPVRQRAS